MPNRDGTGPRGQGLMIGVKKGRCGGFKNSSSATKGRNRISVGHRGCGNRVGFVQKLKGQKI